MKAETWKWISKAWVNSLAFFCSSSCEGSTTDFTLCALSDLYSLFSQMLSENHVVCVLETGATEEAICHENETWHQKGLMGKGRRCCSKGVRLYPPSIEDTVTVVTCSVTNLCDYILDGRTCYLRTESGTAGRLGFISKRQFKIKNINLQHT